MEEGMTKEEQATVLMDVYYNLNRVKKSGNIEEEMDKYMALIKAKLEVLGVVTEDFDK